MTVSTICRRIGWLRTYACSKIDTPDEAQYNRAGNIFTQVLTPEVYNDTEAVKEIGRNSSVVLTAFPFAEHINTLRTHNPTLPVYIFCSPYFEFGDEFWTTSERRAHAFSQWGLKDSNGNQIYFENAALLDLTNVGWTTSLAQNLAVYIATSGATGCFFDTLVDDYPPFALDSEGNFPPSYVNAAAWKQANIDLLTLVNIYLSSTGVITNSGTQPPGLYGAIPNSEIRDDSNGSAVEAYGKELPINSSSDNLFSYAHQTCFTDLPILGATKPVLMEVTGSIDDLKTRLYAYCTYLLVYNSNMHFRYTTVADHGVLPVWREEWNTRIGTPTGAYSQDATGVYVRDFTNGKVVVNAFTVPITYYNTSGYQHWDYKDAGSQITLQPYEAALLIKE